MKTISNLLLLFLIALCCSCNPEMGTLQHREHRNTNSDPTRPDLRNKANYNKQQQLKKMGQFH